MAKQNNEHRAYPRSPYAMDEDPQDDWRAREGLRAMQEQYGAVSMAAYLQAVEKALSDKEKNQQ